MSQRSVSVSDDVLRILTEYDLTEAGEAALTLRCVVCHRLAVDAHQTHCGCTYCGACVRTQLDGGDPLCRGGGSDCGVDDLVLGETVSRNPFLNTSIKRTAVVCPLRPCQVVKPVEEMSLHMAGCPERPMDCPYVDIGCPFRGESAARVEAHLRVEIWGHPRLVVAALASRETHQGGGAGLEDQVAALRSEIATLRDDCINIEGGGACIEDQVAALRSEIATLRDDCINIKNEVQTIKRDSATFINETRLQSDAMRSLRFPSDSLGAQRPGPSNEVQVGLPESSGVTVAFSIDNFRTRMTFKEHVLSPCFYSHTNGYKLQLQVYPRYEQNRTLYMSVFVAICKGEFDDLLLWPMKHSVSISLSNQIVGRDHMTETFNASSYKDKNRKPDTMNVLCGHATFISHKELTCEDDLIHNDKVVLMCRVGLPYIL